MFLDWDAALDDAGHIPALRRVPVSRSLPREGVSQVTGIVVVLAFVGAVIGASGLATQLPVLAVMVLVLVADVGILLFSRRRLRVLSLPHVVQPGSDREVPRAVGPGPRGAVPRPGRSRPHHGAASRPVAAGTATQPSGREIGVGRRRSDR